MATTLDASTLSMEELAHAVVFGKPLSKLTETLAMLNNKDRQTYATHVEAAQYIKSLELKAQADEKKKKK